MAPNLLEELAPSELDPADGQFPESLQSGDALICLLIGRLSVENRLIVGRSAASQVQLFQIWAGCGHRLENIFFFCIFSRQLLLFKFKAKKKVKFMHTDRAVGSG